MGLYIPGIEIPKGSRRAVSIVICSGGTVYYDGLTKLDCKAVPVPKHGRLIDADRLIRMFGCSGSNARVLSGLNIAEQIVKNAPTIIPAEEGET